MYANRSTYAQIASARSTIDRDRPERDLSHPGQAERPRKTRDRGVGREKQTSRRHPTGPMRRRRLVASVLVATLGAVGCSSGSPDVNPVDGAPSVTAAATESQVPEAARVSDGSTSAESADGGPDDTAVAVSEQTSGRADLGGFDDYVPADPDPTQLGFDPDALMGTLDNGLRYYLRSNGTPAESLEMRLVVDAGALVDPPGFEGVAHFVEHMLFNGTERFSQNELGQVLRSIGTEFGPDVNAYTSADETVYSLDVALDDPEALDLAFTVLSQWAVGCHDPARRRGSRTRHRD